MAYQKPYTFRAGTYAKAAEVNANFDTVKNFVDDLDTRITEGLSSSAAYNKANAGGNPSQVFQAAEGTNNNDVVINSQLDTTNSRVAALESQAVWTPPDYGTSEEVSGQGMFASNGVLLVENWSSNTLSFTLNTNTRIRIYPTSTLLVPIKRGTLYNLTDLQYAGTHKFFAS